MNANLFMDKAELPTEGKITAALPDIAPLYAQLDAMLQEKCPGNVIEWKYYNSKSGWVRKTLLKKRNLFFLSIQPDFFQVTFVFGDRAGELVEKSDLPQELVETFKAARKYAEGRGLSIELKSETDLQHIAKLLEIKLA